MMTTRDEMTEVEVCRQEHNLIYKARQEELEILYWKFHDVTYSLKLEFL